MFRNLVEQDREGVRSPVHRGRGEPLELAQRTRAAGERIDRIAHIRGARDQGFQLVVEYLAEPDDTIAQVVTLGAVKLPDISVIDVELIAVADLVVVELLGVRDVRDQR